MEMEALSRSILNGKGSPKGAAHCFSSAGDVRSRAPYGWKVGDDGRYYKAVQGDWQCRQCAELRYSSEGGALVIRGGIMSRILRHPFPNYSSPRPDNWLPSNGATNRRPSLARCLLAQSVSASCERRRARGGMPPRGNNKQRMELCGLSKARPISCSDCPAFQRLQMSRFSIPESPNRFPGLIHHRL